MTRYVQDPAGWWQDSKGRMQPPGSFLDPSLRVPPCKPSRIAASGRSARRWGRQLITSVRRHGA